MKKLILFIGVVGFVLSSKQVNASHAAGLDLTYECISTNQYRVTLTFYRECGGINAPSGNWSAYLNVYSPSSGTTVPLNLFETTPFPVPVFPTISSSPSCPYTGSCSGGSTLQTQIYTYEGIMTLPSQRSDWTILAAMYARNPGITTVNSADDYSICVRAIINNTTSVGCNSSPIWNYPPTNFICANSLNTYSTSATDGDGDSIVYSMINPLNNWNPPGAWFGNYSAVVNNVPYNGGYSYINPLSGTTTFDPFTGNMSFAPTQQQTTIWAIKAEEYRNGALIGSITRDIQTTSLVCNSDPPNLSGIDTLILANPLVNSFNFCANGSSVMTFDINGLTSPPGGSTNITMTANNLPATSTFIVTNNVTNNPIGTFTWVPQYVDLLNSPFFFTVDLIDDACIQNSTSFTYQIDLTSSSGFTFANITTNVSCLGILDGAIDIIVSNVSGVPTFYWTGPNGFTSNNEDISNLDTGQYTVIVTDADGCTSFEEYTVLSNPISLSETHIDPSCFGDSDGSIDLLVSGGVSSYSYSWIGPNGFSSASEDLSGLVSGTYDVIVTDALACSSTYSVILQDPTQLVSNASVTSNYNGSEISCNGFSDGEITASVSGGTAPYTYSLDGFNFLIDSVFPSLSSGLHSIYYKDSHDCLISESISITSPPSLVVVVDNSDDISCYGAGDGAIAISVSGGTQNIVSPFYFYSWTTPSNAFTSALEDLSSITQSGTYYCAVTDANLCGVTTPPITISDAVAITALSTKSDVSCFGYSDGSLSLVINGGNNPYTVDWTNPSAIIPQQINAPYNLSFIEAGDYIYTITDANGCSGPGGVITLIQPADIGISLVNTAVTCYGIGDGVIDLTVSNITNPSFVWTNSSDLSFYETTEDISNLGQGVYNIVVTDGITNCTKSLSEVIQVLTPYNVDTDVAHESCYGVADGQINITPNSAATYTYLWEYPDGTLSNTEDVIDGIPGQYQLDISYSQPTPTAIVTCNVPYDFTIIPATEVVASVASSLVSCEGGSNGSIGLSVSGGVSPYSYLWSNTETTKDILNLTTGLYSVTVLDQKGCFWDTSFTLTSQVFDTVSVTVIPVDCKGDSTASIDIDGITGGVYPYSFSWVGPNGFTTNTEDILNVSAGTYIVDIEDAAGCVIQRYISVDQPATALSTVITNIDSVSCHGGNDGSVELSTIGGTVDNLDNYVFDWAGVNPDSLSSGIYSYIVADLNGCQLVNSFIIPEPAEIIITPTVVEILCPGEATGSISLLLPNNISSSTISWVGPIHNNLPFVSSDFFIDELFAGDYSCVVANENGCTAQLNIYLSEPYTNAGTPTFTTSNYSNYGVSCNGGSDGWIRAGIVGGDYALDTYQYFWDNGDNTDSLYDLKADTYQLILMDNINCTDTFEYVLSQPDSIVSFTTVLSDTNGYNISCYGNSDAFIKLTALGGVYDYSYEWYKNDTLALSLNKDSVYNLEAANYYVVVTDKNNCSFADTITINQPDSLYFNLITATDTCSLNKGFAEIEPFGGVAGYKYYWSTGDLLYYVDTLSEGRYEAILQDANFCESSRPFDIANIPSPIADFTVNPSYKKLEDQLDNPFVFIDNSETFAQSMSTWDWELSDNTMLVDSVAYHSFKAAGDYRVLLIIETEFNCIDTVSYKVKVESFNLWIPTAFNPNSNVIENTVFLPKGEGIKEFSMKVYSRWGGVIFESNDINIGWDGRDGEDEIMIGMYTYYIEVINVFNELHKYEGMFNLLR